MNPKTEALAFRIWQYANPREWDVTVKELAEHLGEHPSRIGGVLWAKRWHSRVRTERAHEWLRGHRSNGSSGATQTFTVDAALSGEGVSDYMRRNFGGSLQASLD